MINPNMINKHGIFQKQLLARFGAIVHHWCSSFDEKFLLTQTGAVVLTGMNKNWKMQLHNPFPMTMMIWLIRDLLYDSTFCRRGKGGVVYFWICYQCDLNYKTFCKLSWTFYAVKFPFSPLIHTSLTPHSIEWTKKELLISTFSLQKSSWVTSKYKQSSMELTLWSC